MISQVKAVPPPNTSEGQSAKKQINQLAAQVKTTSAAVKSATSQLPANASMSQIISALSGLVPQFQTLKNSAESTAKTIQSAGGSLADAFKGEPACKQLG
jgi:outer membrane murein-binding lipoprotein Lpp